MWQGERQCCSGRDCGERLWGSGWSVVGTPCPCREPYYPLVCTGETKPADDNGVQELRVIVGRRVWGVGHRGKGSGCGHYWFEPGGEKQWVRGDTLLEKMVKVSTNTRHLQPERFRGRNLLGIPSHTHRMMNKRVLSLIQDESPKRQRIL